MSDPVYVSRSRVKKIEGVHRRARLETGVELDFGVHGPIKRAYKLDDAPDLALPVDFMVAAAGG